MNTTTPTRPTSRAARQRALERRLTLAVRAVTAVVAVLLVVLVAVLATRQSPAEPVAAELPNPMGGPVQAAPAATGDPIALGALEVVAPDVTMGDVPLDTTVVPQWDVANPTAAPVLLTVGQPRVLEGCCPGPVYVDGAEVPAGGTVTVQPGDVAVVQFPLQMHAGMDGPHHLTVPLQTGGAAAELHVTGNFTGAA